MDKDLEKLLREIIDGIHALLPKPKALSHAEHLILGRLFPAITGQYGNSDWTTGELLSNPVYRDLAGGMTNHKLGLLLSRSIGLDIAGRTLKRVMSVHNVIVWRVDQTGL